MADARIIPIDGQRPPRRPSARARAALDAGATRAGGERERRPSPHTTPLLEQPRPTSRRAQRTVARAAGRGLEQGPGGRRRRPRGTPTSAHGTARTAGPRGRGTRPGCAHGRPSERTTLGAGTTGSRRARPTRSGGAGGRGAAAGRLRRASSSAASPRPAFVRRRSRRDYEVDGVRLRPRAHRHRAARRAAPAVPALVPRAGERDREHPVAGRCSRGREPLRHHRLRRHDDPGGRARRAPAGRHLRMLGADLVFSPCDGRHRPQVRSTLAANTDAERLLADGHLVVVWPEGSGHRKPFSERYKLQRFGRGGFVSARVRTGVPIVPCAIVAPRRSTRSWPAPRRAPACSAALAPITRPGRCSAARHGAAAVEVADRVRRPIPTDERRQGAADDP